MTIKTKQFTLRPFKMADARDLARNIDDIAIIRCLALDIYPYKLQDAKNYLTKNLPEYKKKIPQNQTFAIEINGEVVGSVGLHKIVIGHKAEIGYWLARKHWGQGIMTKVVKLITAFAFKKYKLRRIYAKVYLFNKGSKGVLENNGFKVEGVLKKDVKKFGKFIDAYILAKVK